jgi:hypothetical protein
MSTKATIRSVKSVLKESHTNLADLAKSENINKWSKRKPYEFTKYSQLTDDDIQQKCFYGLNVPIQEMFNTDPTVAVSWQYIKPTKIFRLSDFDGYAHDAKSPFNGIIGINTQYKAVSGTTYDFTLRLNPKRDGQIDTSDIFLHSTSGKQFDTALSNCYFGLALYRNNAADEWANNTSTWCQWCRMSSSKIGSLQNGMTDIKILSAAFSSIAFPEDVNNASFYLVAFVSQTKIDNFDVQPTNNQGQTDNIAVLEGGIFKVSIYKEAEEYKILFGDTVPSTLTNSFDTDYYKAVTRNITLKAEELTQQNDIGYFVNTTITFLNSGYLTLVPTDEMENLEKPGTNIDEHRLRISLFDIKNWVGDYMPTFNNADTANNNEFMPIISYDDVDGSPVYLGLFFEYNGSSQLGDTITYKWNRKLAYFNLSVVVILVDIDTISYSVEEEKVISSSVEEIKKIIITQTVKDNAEYSGIQMVAYLENGTVGFTSPSPEMIRNENNIIIGNSISEHHDATNVSLNLVPTPKGSANVFVNISEPIQL